ncbi:MAG: electron transfer flavoprotein subunit alpha/FixB family protein [Desulfobulbaceae bacterium]|nr:electron transfer flavoprotein subunit alpha/FixB family protein [Desulfobulbaceae bacterium]
MAAIFVYITHKNGTADDSAFELAAAAKALDAAAAPCAIVLGGTADVGQVAGQVAPYFSEVITIANDALQYPNAEVYRKALATILPAKSLLLLTHNSFSMDLAPGLSVKLDAAFASDVVGFEGIEGDTLKLVRQEHGGAVSSRSACGLANGAIISVRAGAFKPAEAGSQGAVVDKSTEVSDFSSKRSFVEVIAAEVGDIDITKSEILVAVGRGIEEEDNLAMVHELAAAMGADVACSRPVVDAKWLEKSRQVGTSGQTVSPKVYLALGISGSFQHMGGIKGSPFIVAVNKNKTAPIFQSADIGVVADILDFIPVLTEKINAGK